MSTVPILIRPIPEVFKGPLGSHKNYVTHIALENYAEYLRYLKRKDENQGRAPAGVAQYTEFRLFLNAVESLNNVLDYLYYERLNQPSNKGLNKFKTRVYQKFPVLGRLPELTNAYKHCVPYKAQERRANQLHRTDVNSSISLGYPEQPPRTEIKFSGPFPDDHADVDAVFKFWLDYHQSTYTNPKTDDLLNA